MAHSVARKKRSHPAISISNEAFTAAVRKGDYWKAGIIVFWCVLQVHGAKGLMHAMRDANSYWRRKYMRSGL